MNCDKCIHADYQAAAKAGMKFWSLCKVGDGWEFSGRLSTCRNRKFKAVDEATMQKRQKWLAGR